MKKRCLLLLSLFLATLTGAWAQGVVSDVREVDAQVPCAAPAATRTITINYDITVATIGPNCIMAITDATGSIVYGSTVLAGAQLTIGNDKTVDVDVPGLLASPPIGQGRVARFRRDPGGTSNYVDYIANGSSPVSPSFDILITPNVSGATPDAVCEGSTMGVTINGTNLNLYGAYTVNYTLWAGIIPITTQSTTATTVNSSTLTFTTVPVTLVTTGITVNSLTAANSPNCGPSGLPTVDLPVIVRQLPTISGATTPTPVCFGANVPVTLQGLIGSGGGFGQQTITYTINGGTPITSPPFTVPGSGPGQTATVNIPGVPVGGTIVITAISNVGPPACPRLTPPLPITLNPTVHPTPSIANVGPGAPFLICSGTSVAPYTPGQTAGDVVPAGTTYTWVFSNNTDVTGEANGGPSATFSTGNLTSSTATFEDVVYTVTATTPNGCTDVFTITVRVNPLPTANAGNKTICGGTPTALNVTNPNGVGGTFNWTAAYGAVTGGTSPQTGVAYNPPAPPAINETLYNTTAGNVVVVYSIVPIGPTPTFCQGPTELANVTVRPEPPIPFGAGGNPSAIVIKDPITNKSEVCAATGIVATTTDATCGAGFSTKWYNDNTTAFGPGVGLASFPATINTTPGSPLHSSQPSVLASATAAVTITWYVSCLHQLTGCETPPDKRKAVSFTVNPMGATPVASFPESPVCQGQAGTKTTVTLTANCGAQTPKWYDAATGGNVVTGPTHQFPSDAPATHSLWVVCVTDKGCETVPRTKVDLIVNPAPAAPGTITLTPSSICQQEPGTPNLAIKPLSDADAKCVAMNAAGFTGVWYATMTGGTAITNPMVDVTVASPVTFYVACKNPSTMCESLTRQAVVFTVLKAPAAPLAITLSPMSACADTPPGATMSNTANCTGSSGGAEANIWYTVPTGGTPLSSAPNTTPGAADIKTWYVACRNLTTGCESLLPRTAVTFTVFPKPTATAPANMAYCNTIMTSPQLLSGTPSGVMFKISGGSDIGLANVASVTSIPAFTTTNSGTGTLTRTITIVPYTTGPNGADNGGTGDDCLGDAVTFTIAVAPPLNATATLATQSVCANDPTTKVELTSTVSGTTFPWTVTGDLDIKSPAFVSPGSGDVASFPGLNASTTASKTASFVVTPTFVLTNGNTVTCTGPTTPFSITVKPRPSSNLTQSQTDVCPNTEVTLDPMCSIPTPTVQWGNGVGSALPAPAGPTVTPNAPDLTYIYTAICVADGCAGTMSSATIRTHRVLVDILKVNHLGGDVNQPGSVVEVVNSLGDGLSVPKNNIVSNSGATPRTWNILARPCYPPVGSIAFEFISGPLQLNYKTVDNFMPHAFFANADANNFYSQASPAYGPGGMLPFYTGGTPHFPNGTYTIRVEGRENAVPGSIPAARNKLAGGSMLFARNITFQVSGFSLGRIGVEEEVEEASAENWASLVQNPISEEIMLRLSGNVGDDIQLNLVNLQGQEVHQSNVKLASRSELSTINVRNFNTGFYILKAVNGEKVKTIKVLKVQE